MSGSDEVSRRGRQLALVIAGLGVAWIAVTAIGAAMGWSMRLRALFDLIILAGFGWAIWQVIGLWRSQKQNRD